MVNNVETLAAAGLIAAHGGDWYAGIGTAQVHRHQAALGLRRLRAARHLRVSRSASPCAQVLDDCGATDTQAVQMSGPSGICVGQDEFGRRIAFEDVPTAGAFMVFDDSRDMFEVARNFAHFFAHESCGFCTPCRVGTSLVMHLMDKLARGHGSPYDIEEMFKLHRADAVGAAIAASATPPATRCSTR